MLAQMLRSSVVIAVISAISTSTHAQTEYTWSWNPDYGGAYFNDTYWWPGGGPPGSDDTAVFQGPGGYVIVQAQGTAFTTIGALRVEASPWEPDVWGDVKLEVQDKLFIVAGTAADGSVRVGYNSSLQFWGGQIQAAQLYVDEPSPYVQYGSGGVVAIVDADMLVSGTFDNKWDVSIQKSGWYGTGGSLTIQGPVVQHVGNELYGHWYVNGGRLDFQQGSPIQVNKGYVALRGTSAAFNKFASVAENQGVLVLGGGHRLETVGDFSNSGLLQFEGASRLIVNGNLSHTGWGMYFYAGGGQLGTIDVAGEVLAKGNTLSFFLNNSDIALGRKPLITYSDVDPEIQFTYINMYGLRANRQWRMYRDIGVYGLEIYAVPNEQFNGDFQPGLTVEEALPGFTITKDQTYGTVALVADDQIEGRSVLMLQDVGAEGERELSLSMSLNVDDSYLHVSFDYRFMTDGKLKILLQGHALDTLMSPEDDPGYSDPGRDTYASYDKWFNLTAMGITGGSSDLEFVLTNLGDPEIRLDGLTVQTVPEPGTMMLVLGGLMLIGRRRHCRKM
jgi:hypothetical protein